MISTFDIRDTTLFVRWNPERRPCPTNSLHPRQWEIYNRLCDALVQGGFTIGRDEETYQRYRCISKHFRYGRHGALEVSFRSSPMYLEIVFFQNLVTVNPNGGRYDFDKLAKMPYLVRKRWEAAVRRLRATLAELGAEETPPAPSPVDDPLAAFNARWDGEYERKRGVHRFERGPDGWPLPEACSRYGRPSRDRNGAELAPGEIRYFRGHDGYLRRGRVYPNMNDMWCVVYGPGRADVTWVHAEQLFRCDPRQVRRRDRSEVQPLRLKELLEKAVKAQDFERAIVLRDLDGGDR